MTDIRITFVRPGRAPEYRHTDVDGDRLLVTTAKIPGVGAGLYFKTDPNGSSVPITELPALIERLKAIAEAGRASHDADGTEGP